MSSHNTLIINIIKCFIFLASVHLIHAEYYSSIVGLEKLIDIEKKFVTAVENYINEVSNTHKKIESFLNKIDLEHKKLNNSESSYFAQPMNAFKIIKRFVIDWRFYDEIIDMEAEFSDFNQTISNLESNYIKPTILDLQGAAQGLSRLQNIYQLETEEIARGYILDYKYSENLKAHDSYIMGLSLFNSYEFQKASEWFIQALNQLDSVLYEGKINPMDELPFISNLDILEYLPIALYNNGNFKLANFMNQQLLYLDPESSEGLKNKELFEAAVIQERRIRTFTNQTETTELDSLYSQVCSFQLTQTDYELSSLHCRYVTNNVPYYFIGPLKMEELNHDPFVAFYHQTIYDNEIEYIMKEADNKVVRSTVENYVKSEVRTSKQTWLEWDRHKFLKNMYQRLEDITGLSLSTGESMQVANYGIGGHYAPHYDFLQDPNTFFLKDGNRILTALFYISDVELGGATAFPFLHLAVPPIKHSLLVWYNIHESTEFDYRTRHAGCPVLKGSKWICNEWFHEVGQELKRPCGLEMVGDKYKYLNNIA